MIHLKTFEEEKWNAIEGEYVILKYDNPKYSEFIENNIGKVKKSYYPGAWFSVEYDNAPEYIEDFLQNKGEFHHADILIRSKNKED